jgi:UMF1 family MFS transporter
MTTQYGVPTGPAAELPEASRPDAIKRRAVLAWGLWDWGSAAWNAVITSFVFGPYVARGVVGDAQPGGLSGNTWLAISSAGAGLLIATIAPVTGQRADAGGKRRRSLAIWTGLVVALMVGLFTIRNDPSYLWAALVLLAAGAVFAEFAGVSYNAMLRQVSTPQTIGRVSGFGWSLGYFGGIVLLLICNMAFIAPEVGWFGVTKDDGLAFRMVALFSAAWFALFALPVLFAVKEVPPGPRQRRVGFFASYRVLIRDVRVLWREDQNAVLFLIASALYRDGLTAIFTFGGILAVTVYGMAEDTVIVFGIVANVVAALGALTMGRLEDRTGPKPIILVSLIGLVLTAVVLLFVHGTTMFWIFGLILCVWVGPAQASSRSFLAQVAPTGREGEMFGLYATTGRAASMIAPGLFALFSWLYSDRAGIVGIAAALLAGAVLMTWVKQPTVRHP